MLLYHNLSGDSGPLSLRSSLQLIIDMDEIEPYQYSPLHGESSTRLIRLEPCENLAATVKCSLMEILLDDYEGDCIDHYTALSYVWGDATDTVAIIVDGCYAYITRTLDSALRHVRDTRRSRFVWADALSINQSNDNEKSQQVSQMGRVYEVAQHTIIYLGDAAPETDMAMALADPHYVDLQVGDGEYRRLWGKIDKGFVEIFRRPWFERVWILQELLLSIDPWLQCGRRRVRWDDFSRTYRDTDFAGCDGDTFYDMCILRTERLGKKYSMVPLAEKDESSNVQDFFGTLGRRRGMGATDPRDMIFAHMGLFDLRGSSFGGRRMINYQQTTKQVYEQFTYHMYDSINIIDLSDAEDLRPLEYRPQNLATWCIDWTMKMPNRTTPSVFGFLMGLPTYWGANWHLPTPPERVVTLAEPSTLVCLGIQTAVILSVTSVLSSRIQTLNESILTVLGLEDDSNVSCFPARAIQKYWHQLVDPSIPRSTRMPNKKFYNSRYGWIERFLNDTRNFGIFHVGITGKRLAELDDGTLALVPSLARPGDSICLFSRGTLPYVLRECNFGQIPQEAVSKLLGQLIGNDQTSERIGTNCELQHQLHFNSSGSALLMLVSVYRELSRSCKSLRPSMGLDRCFFCTKLRMI